MRNCIRCKREVKAHHRYCHRCRSQIMRYLTAGQRVCWISKKMGIKSDTVNFYAMQFRRKESQLPQDHKWFPYKKKLEAMLAKITKNTGIEDFSSAEGQGILAVINKHLDDQKISYATDYEVI